MRHCAMGMRGAAVIEGIKAAIASVKGKVYRKGASCASLALRTASKLECFMPRIARYAQPLQVSDKSEYSVGNAMG